MKENGKTGKVLIYAALIIGAVMMVVPFYWMIITAFKTPEQVAQMPPIWWPTSFLTENFEYVLSSGEFARYIINSIIVAVISVSLTVLVTILTAFAFSRLKFPGRDIIFSLFLGFMMVPFELLAITNYVTIVRLEWIDTYRALTLPYIANVLYIYILRNFFLGIPDSLYWAARIDGASNFKYLWRIMVPISKPAIITIVLLNGIDSWNSFLWPMLVTNEPEMRTVTVGLTSFVQAAGVRYERLMAAAFIVVIPMMILFAFAILGDSLAFWRLHHSWRRFAVAAYPSSLEHRP